jgi:hypothetical protein
MGIDRRLEGGEWLKTNEEGNRAATPGWVAAPARASASVDEPPSGLENVSVQPLSSALSNFEMATGE